LISDTRHPSITTRRRPLRIDRADQIASNGFEFPMKHVPIALLIFVAPAFAEELPSTRRHEADDRPHDLQAGLD